MTTKRCPCGASLQNSAEQAYGTCTRCRVDAHKRPRKRRREPDFVDVPLPGWDETAETWAEP